MYQRLKGAIAAYARAYIRTTSAPYRTQTPIRDLIPSPPLDRPTANRSRGGGGVSGRYPMVERSPNTPGLFRRPGGGLRTMPLLGNLLLQVGGTLPHQHRCQAVEFALPECRISARRE